MFMRLEIRITENGFELFPLKGSFKVCLIGFMHSLLTYHALNITIICSSVTGCLCVTFLLILVKSSSIDPSKHSCLKSAESFC